MGKKQIFISLQEAFPELCKEWDYDKNRPLSPDCISYGYRQKVWWKCPICHQSYQKTVSNRTAPSKRVAESTKCPICLGRVIIPGYNSLKAKFPHIVENEWDYTKNKLDPDTIAPNSNKKYWWKCANGHSYESKCNNKIQNNGGNCPYCSSQRLCPEKSLAYVNPELAKEWHPIKNGSFTPLDVFASTNKYIWWLCPICGHEWRAKGSNRHCGKRGCPECAKGRNTSVPEQLIFLSLKSIFPDAINRYKVKSDEIDIFIPSQNIGIEYDGQLFHTQQKLAKDISKTERILSKGIKLIRFRESMCPLLEVKGCKIVSVKYTPDYSYLEESLIELITQLFPEISCSIKFEDYWYQAIQNASTVKYEESFEADQKRKIAEGICSIAIWDKEANLPLSPHSVRPYSEVIVSWCCPNNPAHKWKNTVKSVSLGYGCKRCSKKHHYSTQEWIDKAIQLHGNKYDYSKVIYINSKTKVKIICPIHGEFEQIPSEHLSGKGCKYCVHQAFHELENLANRYPELAKEWDYERNQEFGVTPESVGIDSITEFWWKCNNGKNHSYLATIGYRVSRNSGCAVCHGKQVSLDTCLATLYPELAKEWCDENDKTPYEISPGSDYMALWKCKNPNHEPYKQKVEVRAKKGAGCKYCSPKGKKHPKDFEDTIKNKFPHIKLLIPYSKGSERIQCQCEYCGHIVNVPNSAT